jgi:hypothetical protein
MENIMVVTAKPCQGSENKTKIYRDGLITEVDAAYYNQNQSVFLVDLRVVIPDSVVICGRTLSPKINATVPSGTEYKYYSTMVNITFPSEALYDTLYLNTNYALTPGGNEIFTIGTRTVPLNKVLAVSLNPRKEYPRARNLGVYRVAGRGYTYLGGEWVNGRINFNTREFGDFMILQDSIAPTIRPVFVNSASARFKINDTLSGIDHFEASINGEWVLMHYDNKNSVIWSELLTKKPMRGLFELTVTDNAGNKSTFKQKIP